MIEKREATRVPFRCEVEFEEVQTGTRLASSVISDLSGSGVFVDSTVVFDQGTIVTLRFTLPSLLMNVKAEVAHSMPAMGMGIRFRDLTPAQSAALEEVVAGDGAVESAESVSAATPPPSDSARYERTGGHDPDGGYARDGGHGGYGASERSGY